MHNPPKTNMQLYQLKKQIKQWGKELGFADVGISHTDLSNYETDHFNWLGENYHGDMDYMAKHGTKRTRPNELEPGTQAIISVRLNYFDRSAKNAIEQLQSPDKAYISRYALNKDYHKIMRKRLQKLASKIDEQVENFSYRAFSDSAPVLEKAIAQEAGIGFIGKHSLVIHPGAGSWFFLGELYCNLPIPADQAITKQGCGPCTACLDECPTQAIKDGNMVDARRCISYLTIEYKGEIADELKEKMGNRIYGCDDCQLVCPWNKFTEDTEEESFKNRHILDKANLLELLEWDETTFLKKLEGSPIRRIGYPQWQRNLCTAIGNENYHPNNITALKQITSDSPIVLKHQDWAIKQQKKKEKSLKSTQGGTDTLQNSSYLTPNKPAIAPKYYGI